MQTAGLIQAPNPDTFGRRIFVPPLHITGGTRNPVNMFASVPVNCVPSLTKSFLHTLSYSVAVSSASLVKSAGKNLLAMPTLEGVLPFYTPGGIGVIPTIASHAGSRVVAMTAVLQCSPFMLRQIATTLISDVVNWAASIDFTILPAPSTNQELSAAVSAVGSLFKEADKILSAAIANTADFLNEIDKLISGTVASVGSFVNQALTNLSTSLTASSTMTMTMAYVRTLAASAVSLVGSLTALHAGAITNKAMSAAVACVATLPKQAGKIVTGSVTAAVPTIRRQIGKLILPTITVVPSVVKQVPKLLSKTIPAVASVSAHKGFIFTQTMVASTIRAVASFSHICRRLRLQARFPGVLTLTPEVPDDDLTPNPKDPC